jgi:predicted transcriptional regulator
MAVQLKPEQEQELNAIAAQGGLSVDEHAQRAVEHYLLWHKDFVAAVKVGLAEADRGELLEHDEVVERIERLLAS